MKRLMVVFMATLCAACLFADGGSDAPAKRGRRKGLPSGGFLKVANAMKIHGDYW